MSAKVMPVTIVEPARRIPVAAKVDVLVAGGGAAGLAAAVTAAREGASTLLVERHAFLGGAATANLVSKLSQHREVLYGFSAEIIDDLIRRKAAVSGRVINFDPEGFKKLALDLIRGAGVRLLLDTWVVAPIVEDDALHGVFIENKSGRQALLAKTTIDCTGDADVAHAAGVPVHKGQESNGRMRPMVLLFRMGGIDFKPMVDYARSHPDQFSPDPNRQVNDIEEGVVRMWGFFDLVEEASRRGELPGDFHSLELEGVDVERGICYVNGAEVFEVDGTNAWDITRAEMAARDQIPMLAAFVRKYIPGCRKAYVLDTAASIGVRETRHIHGKYTLTEDDCASARAFEDRVVRVSTHLIAPGWAAHSPDGKEGSVEDPYRTMVAHERKCFIPYRCMVPEKVDGLLVAGRSISQTHSADAWTRSQVWCMGMGQAAGTAAALAVMSGVDVRSVDVERIQDRLRNQGAPLDEIIEGIGVEVPLSADR
jgi:hypothetical protein